MIHLLPIQSIDMWDELFKITTHHRIDLSFYRLQFDQLILQSVNATHNQWAGFLSIWFMSLFDANHENIYGAISFTVGKYD